MNTKTLVFIFGLLFVAVVFADPDPEPEADPEADGDLARSNYYRNTGSYYGHGRGRGYDGRYTQPNANYYGRYGYPGHGNYYGRYGQGYDRYNDGRYAQRYGNYYGRYGQGAYQGYPGYGKAYAGNYRTY